MLHTITEGDTPLSLWVLLMMPLLGQILRQPQLDVSSSHTWWMDMEGGRICFLTAWKRNTWCVGIHKHTYTDFPPRRPQSDQLQPSLQQTFNVSLVRGVSLGKSWKSHKLVRGLAWEHTLFSTDQVWKYATNIWFISIYMTEWSENWLLLMALWKSNC